MGRGPAGGLGRDRTDQHGPWEGARDGTGGLGAVAFHVTPVGAMWGLNHMRAPGIEIKVTENLWKTWQRA